MEMVLVGERDVGTSDVRDGLCVDVRIRSQQKNSEDETTGNQKRGQGRCEVSIDKEGPILERYWSLTV